MSAHRDLLPSSLTDKPIVLVGMMGSGKSSVGRRLASRLRLPFYDADDEMTGVTLSGTSYAAATFGYDADGQRTSETTGFTAGFAGYTSQFGYDFDGQLTSITKAGNTTTFRYDPLGRQVSRTVNRAVTGYGFDGGQLILEG